MRALLGGWHAWLAAGGETESQTSDGVATQATTSTQQQIASPNPTIREGAATSGGASTRVDVTPVQATSTTKASPMKTTKSKTKSKRRRTR